MSKASVYFNVFDISKNHDVKQLKKKLDTFSGVISVSVNDKKNNIAVDYDTTAIDIDRIEKTIGSLGYRVTGIESENHIM